MITPEHLPPSLTLATLLRILNEMHDEIAIWDNNYTVLYMNSPSYRHYGVAPEDLVGKTFDYFTKTNKFWSPSTLPYVYEHKRAVIQKQVTFLGDDITTISVPILDKDGNIEFVIQTARDDERDLQLSLTGTDSEEQDRKDITAFIKTEMVHRSPFMKKLLRYAEKAAQVPAPCLIWGETGTGKSQLAKYMHSCSPRRNKNFVTINVAAISPSLLESELFGYKKGAFSGALQGGKKGLLELAEGGTLFLDEIGEMPYQLQAKLLHVIQEKEFIPVGGVTPVKIDFALISATNNDLTKMIELGRFREDLYHRIKVFEIFIPPLRERREDMLALANLFLNRYNKQYRKNCKLSEEVWDAFIHFEWKGNVRELAHLIEMLVATSEEPLITHELLPNRLFTTDVAVPSVPAGATSLDGITNSMLAEMVRETYAKTGSTRKMAVTLGISQSRASRLVRRFVTQNAAKA